MGFVVKRTTGNRLRTIAAKYHLPLNTVEAVIKAYNDGLIDDALEMNRIVIDGVVSMSILENTATGEFTARCRVSSALQARLKNNKEKLKAIKDARSR
ncbi:hypothetical protein D3C71_1317760 [compost metagenome]